MRWKFLPFCTAKVSPDTQVGNRLRALFAKGACEILIGAHSFRGNLIWDYDETHYEPYVFLPIAILNLKDWRVSLGVLMASCYEAQGTKTASINV